MSERPVSLDDRLLPPGTLPWGEQQAEQKVHLFALLDDEARVLHINESTQAFLGRAAEDCIGRIWFELLEQQQASRARSLWEGWQERDCDAPLTLELTGPPAGQPARSLRWILERLIGAADQPASVALLGLDLGAERTGQQEARKRVAWYRSVLAGTLDPLITIDSHGIIQAASHSVERFFGYSAEELLGQNLKILMPEPHRSQHDEYLAEYRRSGTTNILGRTREFEAIRKDGSSLQIELSVSRVDVEGYEQPYFTGSFRDITARKHAEQASRREAAMQRAFAEIGESAAILTHELKNPITGISVALRALADQIGEDHRTILEDLVLRMRRIEGTIRRTLSFARPLDLHPGPCEARVLMGKVIQDLRERIDSEKTSIEIRSEPDCVEFEADAEMIHEALHNLVINAIEASEEPVRIVFSARKLNQMSILLCVEDDGPGIPASQVDQLFQPFATSKKTGNGLGLAIVKKIVLAHDGSIDVRDSELGGACFEMELPTRRNR